MRTSLVHRWTRTLRGSAQAGSSARGRRRERHIALEALEGRVTLSLTLQMVLDINPNTLSSYPSEMVAIGSTTYFTADDGVHGTELWKSDGTAAGTILVRDIITGSGGSNPNRLTNVNGTLFFRADDGVHGTELWRSDGTAAGTVMVKDIQAGGASSSLYLLTDVNGTLFLVADDGTHGSQLWKSDGTAAGTVTVKTFNYANSWESPGGLTNVNGTLFFTASDGVHGMELWKSDGTAAGTILVKDIITGGGGSHPNNLTNAGGTLFFTANSSTAGVELWRSDGTAAGTRMVKRLDSIESLTNVNGTLFFKGDDGYYGLELWKSDGTAAGTTLVKDIFANPYGPPRGAAQFGSYPGSLTNVNGTLYFSADDGVHGAELWRSDGTTAGTTLVKDIYPGGVLVKSGDPYLGYFYEYHHNSSAPGTLANVNGTLFFSAQDETNGRELWRSDGAATGTTLVEDIDPGLAGSSPNKLTSVNGPLFFSADDGVHGVELWKLVDDSPPPPPAMRIGDVSVVEGHAGNRAATFTVTLSAPSTLPVTVSYSTANGTAASPSDYTAASGTLVIPAGQTTGTILVPIIGDRLGEADETFVVNLSGATNATIADGQAVGTIVDDEPRISISDASKQEGNGKKTTLFTFTVTLSAAYDQAVTMSFQTVNGTATTGDGDYAAGAGTLTFAPGETTRTITIVVNGDGKRESNETFYLDLYGKSSNSLFFKYRGIGTILNDD